MTDTESATGAERRSRLTPEREAELYLAVMDLLREVGYEALTMDAVAARAHISKATLYRQWQGKPGLITSALRHLKPITFAVDTGSLAGDLYEAARRLAAKSESDGALMASLTHVIIADQALGTMLREVVVLPEQRAFTELVRRAVERGELDHMPASTNCCAPILVHAVLNRPLCEGAPANEDYLIDIVDTVILPSLRHS